MERTYTQPTTDVKTAPKKRYNKAGEWMRDPNRETWDIIDMRAVMK